MSDAHAPHAGILYGPYGLRLDPSAHQVFVGTAEVPLTQREFDLLRDLLDHRGQVLSADDLALRVWGYETFGSRNFVEAHISRLRRKLRDAGAGDAIRTVRGVGYVIRS
jgi:DNA-binding response OmpR family regulator